ncbi:uncharacterized protein F5Z01DRAFT_623077 [Emericellopsis atlantica]|uniref:Zn(2)-C6 fungal-type domain-containing protein n=1 Tax=Emericellopsis atlantica TaxID=2614577 RepID=A0A9P7ZLB9_9HYPO|nr:uncharacterized protein F5Z01DRAFT_623077 [Emericellopsis atlantica]KAG9253817.1 hypothetical protein F5Z01DRAFT_623077 [Emericellopsis atlantica]
MGSRINKACDGCRVRKVKCSGSQPCSQCAHLDLPCQFSPPTGKRKPGVRNRLVEQLRGGNGPPPAPPSVTSVAGIINAPSPASSTGTAIEYTPAFFQRLLPDYESAVYPLSPIITTDEMRAAIDTMGSSHEDAALVYGFAAVTINLTQISWTTLNGDVATQMTDLIQRCLASHRLADLGGVTRRHGMTNIAELPVTVKRVMTCIFMEISMMAFRLFERSFAILREAIALMQTMKISRLKDLPKHELARRQRLYWECFIHEKFVTIMSGCPSILPPLSTGLPLEDETIPAHVDCGFKRLMTLFAAMDDSFLQHWTAQQQSWHTDVEPMTAEWVERKQAQLDAHEVETAQAEEELRIRGQGGLTELQHADIFVTRLWLRTLIWQLALSHGLLRSAPPDTSHQGLSLHFPAHRLSSQLRSLVSKLSTFASVGRHGSGILQKLFEITTTVADVLAIPPGNTASQEDVKSRMEDFIFVVGFLFRFERISPEERAYMREKMEVLRQLYTVVDFGSLAVGSA